MSQAIKKASMRDLRAALPQYFAANVPALVKALSDKVARVDALALALVGGAIERAQSGNLPAVWLDVRSAGAALKGATKQRADKALALVDAVRPGAIAGPVEDFESFAADLCASLREALTPPAPKAKAAAINWKARAEAAEAEAQALRDEVTALRAALASAGAKAPESSEALV
jgi:hypothetical protein